MHVVITGASSGIGEALARCFAAKGCRLTLIARRQSELERVSRAVEGSPRIIVQDLGQDLDAHGLIRQAEGSHGPVDVLVNNAGITRVIPSHQHDPEHIDYMMRVNLIAPLKLSRAVLPSMLDRGSGVLVDVASIVALNPIPTMICYSASKAGLATWSETLRSELEGTGVHVLTVYPGPVATAMAQQGFRAKRSGLMQRLFPAGDADVLAARIARGVENQTDRIVYPDLYQAVRALPGLTRMVTKRLARR